MTSTTSSSFTLQELLSHREWAQRLARRLVGPADADDLIQDGWLAGLLVRPADRDGLRPWLATVLARAAGRRRRGDQRRSAREEVSVSLTESAIPTPEALVAQVEVQRLLAELVLALEAPVRDVILLRFYQGLSSPEIARELQVPEGTVRWRVKNGLAELRQRLDERHGGRRDHWFGLLAPIAGSPARRGKAGPAAGAVLLAGVCASLVVWWPSSRSGMEAAPTATDGSAKALASTSARAPANRPGAAGANRPPQLAAVATTDKCREQLAETRRQLTATEVEFVETARVSAPSALFDHGAPNAAAEAVLGPLVTRALSAAEEVKPAGHTVTCRTLICRVSVLLPANAPAFDWQRLLRQDPELRERAPGTSARERGPALQDPVAGGSYHEEHLYLNLWTPGAEAFSRAQLIAARAAPGVPPPVFGPLPSSLDACRPELAAAEQRLATMNDVIQRHMLPERRWERSSPNRELTSEMQALANEILGLPRESRVAAVDCRQDVCQVDLDRQTFPSPNDWKKLFTPEWRRRARGPMSVGSWRNYFTILPPKPPSP